METFVPNIILLLDHNILVFAPLPCYFSVFAIFFFLYVFMCVFYLTYLVSNLGNSFCLDRMKGPGWVKGKTADSDECSETDGGLFSHRKCITAVSLSDLNDTGVSCNFRRF